MIAKQAGKPVFSIDEKNAILLFRTLIIKSFTDISMLIIQVVSILVWLTVSIYVKYLPDRNEYI